MSSLADLYGCPTRSLCIIFAVLNVPPSVHIGNFRSRAAGDATFGFFFCSCLPLLGQQTLRLWAPGCLEFGELAISCVPAGAAKIDMYLIGAAVVRPGGWLL